MKKSKDEIIFLVIDYVVITLLCLICIVPLLYQLACSFSSGAALDAGKVFLWPVGFTTSAYRLLFSSSNIVRYFLNSLLLTGVGTVLGLVFTVLCAYPLSKKYMKGRKTISFLVTPMGRFVESEELLGGVFFLCDDRAASAVTGVVLPIDGGFAAYSGV